MANVNNNLIIHYPLNGAPNNITQTEYDISGNKNDAQCKSDIDISTFKVNTSPIRYPFYYQFDTNKYLKNTDLTLDSNIWSLSIWYYFRTKPLSNQSIVHFSKLTGADNNTKFYIMPSTNNITIKIEDKTNSSLTTKEALWTHICLTSNGTDGKVYENGKLITILSLSSTISNCLNLGIGCKSSNSDFTFINAQLNGNLSDFRLYSSCLTANDVLDLYNMKIIL